MGLSKMVFRKSKTNLLALKVLFMVDGQFLKMVFASPAFPVTALKRCSRFTFESSPPVFSDTTVKPFRDSSWYKMFLSAPGSVTVLKQSFSAIFVIDAFNNRSPLSTMITWSIRLSRSRIWWVEMKMVRSSCSTEAMSFLNRILEGMSSPLVGSSIKEPGYCRPAQRR